MEPDVLKARIAQAIISRTGMMFDENSPLVKDLVKICQEYSQDLLEEVLQV